LRPKLLRQISKAEDRAMKYLMLRKLGILQALLSAYMLVFNALCVVKK